MENEKIQFVSCLYIKCKKNRFLALLLIVKSNNYYFRGNLSNQAQGRLFTCDIYSNAIIMYKIIMLSRI